MPRFLRQVTNPHGLSFIPADARGCGARPERLKPGVGPVEARLRDRLKPPSGPAEAGAPFPSELVARAKRHDQRSDVHLQRGYRTGKRDTRARLHRHITRASPSRLHLRATLSSMPPSTTSPVGSAPTCSFTFRRIVSPRPRRGTAAARRARRGATARLPRSDPAATSRGPRCRRSRCR